MRWREESKGKTVRDRETLREGKKEREREKLKARDRNIHRQRLPEKECEMEGGE